MAGADPKKVESLFQQMQVLCAGERVVDALAAAVNLLGVTICLAVDDEVRLKIKFFEAMDGLEECVRDNFKAVRQQRADHVAKHGPVGAPPEGKQ